MFEWQWEHCSSKKSLASMGDELCLCDWNEMPCAERNKHRLLRYMKADFMKFATERGMVGIKGHRSVGGFRASCYNAMPKESVQALIDCMQEFEKLH